MGLLGHAGFDRSPSCQHQIHVPDRLPRSWKTDCLGWWHLVGASFQIAAALFPATDGSNVPRCHSCATHENNDRPFSKVADRLATCARNIRFAGGRKYHSGSYASHAHAVDLFSLRLADMVGFSTIGYHSGRLGKFVEIWSSDK